MTLRTGRPESAEIPMVSAEDVQDPVRIANKLIRWKQAIESALRHLASIHWEVSTVINDHGNLAGLTDDDHTQYVLADGTRSVTGAITFGGNVEIDGVLNHDGGTAGFYGVAPVAQALALTTKDAGTIDSGDATTDGVIGNNRTRIEEIETVLSDLGFIAP